VDVSAERVTSAIWLSAFYVTAMRGGALGALKLRLAVRRHAQG
jgi:hypothetical protein